MAANRFAFLTQATMLTISAIGGVKSIASPPRAANGDPQPGCNSNVATRTANATNDKYRPTRPEFNRLGTFLPMSSFGSNIYGDSSLTSTGWLTVSTGARLNWTLTVTVLPTNSWGTRHECEQTPPQPNSMLPESTCLPSVEKMAKVGFGGWRKVPLSWR